MSTYIPLAIRRHVIERTNERCEYCGKPAVSFFPHEVDHVIAQKHGGKTSADNLAYACFECNRYKGSDIASFCSGQRHGGINWFTQRRKARKELENLCAFAGFA